jgi:uncharacterized protein YndB with AHSA1/START domain
MNTGPITVCVTRTFTHSAERVFDAFLDVEKARRFLFATENGVMVRAEMVPLVGGVFIFTDRRDGVNVDHVGEYFTMDRPARLVFDFGVPAYSPQRSRVEIEIEADGPSCTLVLTQYLPAKFAAYAERTEHGWSVILENLAKVLG